MSAEKNITYKKAAEGDLIRGLKKAKLTDKGARELNNYRRNVYSDFKLPIKKRLDTGW